MKEELGFLLNGAPVEVTVDHGQRLIDLLRVTLRMTGTKEGCSEGECGACSVLVDGRLVNSCIYPAAEIGGREVLTIEGLLGPDNRLSPLQRSFVESGAIQCGFCTPGMILAAHVLLESNPDPSDAEIRDALVGNLCRCTGYLQILDAVRDAARRLREASHA